MKIGNVVHYYSDNVGIVQNLTVTHIKREVDNTSAPKEYKVPDYNRITAEKPGFIFEAAERFFALAE